MRKTSIIVLLLLLSFPAWSQNEGDNGFSPLYNPQFKSELPEEVCETSGLFFHNGRLWTHNDSGGKPILYALDTVTFEVVQRITLANAKNKDWEDVCTDGKTVFVGDFGNNKGSRKNLRIFTFPLSAIPNEGDTTVTVDSIKFRFADQTNFEKGSTNTTMTARPCLPRKSIFICSAKAGKRARPECTDFRKHLGIKSLR